MLDDAEDNGFLKSEVEDERAAILLKASEKILSRLLRENKFQKAIALTEELLKNKVIDSQQDRFLLNEIASAQGRARRDKRI